VVKQEFLRFSNLSENVQRNAALNVALKSIQLDLKATVESSYLFRFICDFAALVAFSFDEPGTKSVPVYIH